MYQFNKELFVGVFGLLFAPLGKAMDNCKTSQLTTRKSNDLKQLVCPQILYGGRAMNPL